MDRLTLRIENRSDAAGDMPEDISVQGKGIRIGRKASNDWSLPDNTRFISGHHVTVTYHDGSYALEDVSTNGTFVNGASKRISGQHKLADGDTIRIGSYIVTVVIEEAEDPILPQISGAQGVQAPPMAGKMGSPTTGVQSIGAPTASRGGGAQAPDFSQFQTGSKGATGVQRPGAVSMPPGASPAPSSNLIPDDFDDDLLGPTPADTAENTPPVATPNPISDPTPELAPAPAPAPAPKAAAAPPDATPAEQVMSAADPMPVPQADIPSEPTPAPENVSSPIPDPFPGPFSEPAIDATPDLQPLHKVPAATAHNPDGPFSMSDPTAAPVVPREPARDPEIKPTPVIEKTDLTPRGLGERFAETAAPRANPEPPAPKPEPAPISVAVSPTPEPVPVPPTTNALLEGFLEGAAIKDADALTIPLHDLGVMLGRCARLGTQEMMQMLQDRSAVKLFVAQEDRTMRIASGNNPMKFMMDPDDAFKALFVEPRDGYQTGPDGFDNALSDIRQHQRAMMAAIQPALADMLEGLAPTEISQDVGGGGGVLSSGARKNWEEFTKRWESRAAQGENGMLDAFIDAFSRRYNQALDTL